MCYNKTMKNQKLIVIRGYPGAGKTTLSRKYAEKHDLALLSQDVFVFDFNPSAEVTRKILPFDGKIGFKNLLSVLENYMRVQKPILLEGALAARSEDDHFDFMEVLAMANKYGYQIISVTLVADETVRRKRQEERGYVLPLQLDRKLVDIADKPLAGVPVSHVINTAERDLEEILADLHSKILKDSQ